MISLKIFFDKTSQTKVMRFSLDIPIRDVVAEINEKLPTAGGQDFGVFQPVVVGRNKARWFKENHTLKYYELRSEEEVIFRKKHRILPVLLKDGSQRKCMIDDSATVQEILEVVAKKCKVTNYDEYGLRVEGRGDNTWLNKEQGLHEQDVTIDDIIIFGKKLYFSDEQIDQTDPVQVNFIYVQSNEDILTSKYPTTKEEAVQLAALQVQIQHGNHNPSRHKSKFLKLSEYLPAQYAKNKSLEGEIYSEHRKLVGLNEVNAKFRYIQLVRGLSTYGITFFQCKERGKKKGKLQTVLIGIAKDRILRMDYETKEIIEEDPLVHLKQWAAARDTFTFDFGDHKEAYYTVQTNEAQAISQLIAGYIDIIIKNRNNSVKVLSDGDDGNYAQIEDANPTQVGHISTMSQGTTMGPGQGGIQRVAMQSQPGQATISVIPESQKVQIRDVNSSKRVAALLRDEFADDIKLVNRGRGQKVGKSNLSEQQWTDQLVGANKDTASALASLVQAATVDPSVFNKNALDEAARVLGNELLKLTQCAKGASGGKNKLTQEAMLGAAQRAAAAAYEIFELSDRIAQNPYDDRAKAQLVGAERKFREAQMLLQSAQVGNLSDAAAEELIGEAAKALSRNVDEVVACSLSAVKTLTDGTKMRNINGISKQVSSEKELLMATVETLSSALLDPDSRSHVVDSSNSLASVVAQLCSAVKESGAAPEYLQSIGYAAKGVNDSIQRLINAMDTAEEFGISGLDFQGPAERVATSIAEMRMAGNDIDQLKDAVKMIALATNELVTASKAVAESDPESRDRILNTANAAAEMVTRLIEAAKATASRPDDMQARTELMNAAQRVFGVVQELVVDAGRQASIVNFRAAAKQAAAATTALVSNAREISQFINNSQQKEKLLQDSDLSVEATNDFIESIKYASKNPSDPAAQTALLDSVGSVVGPLSTLVASAKVSSFNVSDPNKKQALQYSANELGDRLKDLMQTCEAFNANEGHQEIEEAMQQFDAVNAQLEAAEFKSRSGLMRPGPGQSRDAAKALLEKSFSALSESARNIVLAAKGEGGSLGQASLQAAEASSLVSSGIEAVAATTPLQKQQQRILGAGKQLNSDLQSFITAARGVNSKRNDPTMEAGLARAYQQLKGAISSVLAASAGLDSSELDEAMKQIQTAARSLQPSLDPNRSYQDATESLVMNAKALGAASAQLTSVAKTNPAVLASACKIVASTCDDILLAASEAAGQVDSVKAQDIIRSTQELMDKVAALLSSAKTAVALKTPDSESTLDKSAVSVASAASELEGLVSGSDNPQVHFATNQIMAALETLSDFSVPGKSIGEVVDEIERGSSNLAGNSSRLARAAKVGTDKLGIYAKETAADIEAIIDVARAAMNAPEGDTTGTSLSPEALAIKEAVDAIVADPGNNGVVVPNTKTAAVTTANLMKQAKVAAQQTKDRNQQAAILTAIKQLVTSTSALANAARAPKDDNGKANLVNAAKELLANTLALEEARGGQKSATGRVPANSAQQLVSASKTLATSANLFLSAVNSVSSNPNDPSSNQSLQQANKTYNDAIKNIYAIAQTLNPSVQKVKEAESKLQNAIGDLDQAAFDASVGSLNPQLAGGKTFQQCQEALVAVCKAFTNDISLLTNSEMGTDEFGSAAEGVSDHTRRLVAIAKASAASSTDTDLQQRLLSLSKDLAESMLNLVDECDSSDPDLEIISERSTQASNSIGELMSALRENVELVADMEEATRTASGLSSSINPNTTASGKAYSKIKEEISQAARSLNAAAGNLNSSDVSNIGQISLGTKQLLNSLNPLIALANEASATTKDLQAKTEIANTVRSLSENVVNMMRAATSVGTNPGDRNAVTQLSNTYKQFLRSVPAFLQAVKGGDVTSKAIDESIERIKASSNDLSTSAIFAQAGQLEKSTDPKPFDQLADELVRIANSLASQANTLSGADSMTPEELSASVSSISGVVESLSASAINLAGKSPDAQLQQGILAASQAAVITSQQLLLAAADANKNPDDNTAAETLGVAVSTSNDSVQGLVNTIQESVSEAMRGASELDNTARQIQLVLTENSQVSNPTINSVVEGCKKTAEAVASIVFATGQEDLVKGAKIAQEGIQAILGNISAPSPSIDVQRDLLNAAQAAAGAMMELLNLARSSSSDDPQQRAVVQGKAEDVTSLLNELIGVCNQYPEASGAQLAEENLEVKAEQGLLEAAEMIKRAAQELSFAQIKQVDVDDEGSTMEKLTGTRQLRINEAEIAQELIDAAREVTQITGELMSCAAVAQGERKEQNKNNVKYRNDPTWANGLISSSKNVAGGVMMLVRVCNAAVAGDAEEEAIIATAKSIAASTAQLIAASRVRADPNSRSQISLDEAAKGVARSTNKMVNTAKRQGEIQEQIQDLETGGGFGMTGGQIKKLEQQMEILRLEKQLEQARKGMGSLNRQGYN
eukprot:TRINITY_DN6336_c0_g1_i1.p1 TRINITY_DN6336_c0_g1~~TRINITY_DN6336_c0_g1_i1.p1  ORF type:complete len:2441 (-),score=740.57 TRINITY_DN6336_c0_g1_i1:26-7348(-)